MKKILLILILTLLTSTTLASATSFYSNMRTVGLKYLLYEDFTKYTSTDNFMSKWEYYATNSGVLKLRPEGLEIGYDAGGSHRRFKIISPTFDYYPNIGVTLVALVEPKTSVEHDLEVFFEFGGGYYGGIGAHGWDDRIRWYYQDGSGRWYDKDFSPTVYLRTNYWYLFVIKVKSSEIMFQVYSWNNGDPQLLGQAKLVKQTPTPQQLRVSLGSHNDQYNAPYQYGIYKQVLVVLGYDVPIDTLVEGLQNPDSLSGHFYWKYFTNTLEVFRAKYTVIEGKNGETTPLSFREYTHTIRIHNNLDSDVQGYPVTIELTPDNVGEEFMWDCEECIRIVDSMGNDVPAYIEVWDSENKYVKLTVKTNLYAGKDTILTLYSSIKYHIPSSPKNVFELYEDFNTLDTNVWRTVGNTHLKPGYVEMYTNNGGWASLMSVQQFQITQNYGYRLEFSFSIKGDIGGQGTGYVGFAEPVVPGRASWALSPSIDHVGMGEGWCKDWGICTETTNSGSRTGGYCGLKMSSTSSLYTYYVEIEWFASKVKIQFQRGSTVITREYTTNIPDEPLVAWFGIDDNSSWWGGLLMRVHYVRVKKIIPVEPTVTVE